MARYPREVIAALEKQAFDRGGEPELTADNVSEVCAAVGHSPSTQKTDWAVLSTIFVTIANHRFGSYDTLP